MRWVTTKLPAWPRVSLDTLTQQLWRSVFSICWTTLVIDVASVSTTVPQSQTVQWVTEDPSIWCMGPRHLVTFLLKECQSPYLLTYQLYPNGCWISDDVHFVQWSSGRLSDSSCYPTVCLGPLSPLSRGGWKMSSSLPNVGYGVKVDWWCGSAMSANCTAIPTVC